MYKKSDAFTWTIFPNLVYPAIYSSKCVTQTVVTISKQLVHFPIYVQRIKKVWEGSRLIWDWDFTYKHSVFGPTIPKWKRSQKNVGESLSSWFVKLVGAKAEPCSIAQTTITFSDEKSFHIWSMTSSVILSLCPILSTTFRIHSRVPIMENILNPN